MKKLLFVAFLISNFSLQAQTLVSKTLLISYNKQQIDSMLTANGIPTLVFSTRLGIDAYKLVYNTTDFDSTVKIASGLLVVPRDINCDFSLINYSHGTTSVKEDVPSRLNGEGMAGIVSASNGFVMCEPDYLGMGDSPWPHYYLHAPTQALANIDLLRASKEACQQLGVQLNDNLFITGYSQGGFSAMATHKYIQTYFPNEFPVTKCIPGAGSYDMSGAMVDLMLSDVSYPSPGYLPFLIFTWNPIYNFFTNPSDYLKSPYDTTLPPLINGLNSIDDINNFMPDTPKLIFHQHMIDSFATNPNHSLRMALKDNDIYEWIPQAPMLMIHCRGDRQVPIENTRNAYNYFVQHGATQIDTIDLDPSLGHGDCGELTLIYLKSYLDSIALTDACLTASIREQKNEIALEIFPNPSNNILNIRFAEILPPDYEIAISDLNGKIILKQKLSEYLLSKEKQIDISAFNTGVYILKVSGRDANSIKRFTVIH